MNEIDNFSITEAARLGISAVVRSASKNGLSLISRNGDTVALVMPANVSGMKKLTERLIAEVEKSKTIPTEVNDILQMYKKLLEKFPAEA